MRKNIILRFATSVGRSCAISTVIAFGLQPASAWGQLPTVPPGFAIEIVAEGIPATAKMIVVAPDTFGAFGGQIFVADFGDGADLTQGLILRVDPTTGNVSTFASAPAFAGDVVFGPGGDFGTNLYVNSDRDPASPENGIIYVFSADGTRTTFGSPSVLPDTLFGGLGIAFSTGGEFGNFVYAGASAGVDAVTRLPPSGGNSATVFWSLGSFQNGSPDQLCFGPGTGGFGNDLYVAVRNNGGGPVLGGVYSLDSTGTPTPLVTENDSPLIDPITIAIEFGPGGAFGTNLYATGGHGSVVRIDSSGNVEEFVASSSLTSTQGLAFDGDKTMYFIDPDAGRLYRVFQPTVPAVSSWGLGVMVLLILFAATLMLRRATACPD